MMENNENGTAEETRTDETGSSGEEGLSPSPYSSPKFSPAGSPPDKKKGKGPISYTEKHDEIRLDLGKLERENRELRKEVKKTTALIERFLTTKDSGDLTSFVDRGLSGQGLEKAVIPGRDEIARSWESGKHTFEELIADYERLRGQKIWSQEDLEGILVRFETLAGEISQSVLTCQNTIEGILPALSGHSEKKVAEEVSREEISRLSKEMSEIGGLISGSREAILGAIADKNFTPLPTALPELDPELLAHVLQKIGNIEELLKENRPVPRQEASLSAGSASSGNSRGIRESLFSKLHPEVPIAAGKPVVTPRIKRLGFVWLMAALAIVAVVARVKHSGPTPELANPVATRNTLPPPLISSPIRTRSLDETQKFQSIEPIISGLDKLREGVGENGQAIADLSGKIDQALSKLPKGASLSDREKRLIDEGQELEWLVKTWPTGPGRKELLRMMRSYVGE